MPLIHYELPDDLHRRAKVAAAQRGITLKAAVIEAIEQWVTREQKQRKS